MPGFKPPPNPPNAASSDAAASATKARLPQDRIGILEDRIAADARGDTDAWFELVEEYKRRNKLPEVRKVYDRFLKVFPTAVCLLPFLSPSCDPATDNHAQADVWDSYVSMELEHNNFFEAEKVFTRAVNDIADVRLWTTYLNYVRRRHNLNNDPDGKHRKVVSEVFEYVLRNAGRDKDSGDLWMEYIQFLKSIPGNIGGTTWQDQQKKDTLRAGYHKAICVPHSNIGTMWSEYTKFEQTVDRPKSHQILQKHSPDYVQARQARHALEGITKDLERTTVAKLPPALGFDGDFEYAHQVSAWKQWIDWEKSDPLLLMPDQPEEWKNRVIYVYKQSLMALRFWPEMWFSAVEFCFSNGLDAEGDKLLQAGTAANPESCLLAFQRAERIEATTAGEGSSEDNLKRRGELVRKPYDDVIDALYALINQTQQRQAGDIKRLEEHHAMQAAQSAESAAQDTNKEDDDDDDADDVKPAPVHNSQLNAQIAAVKRGHTVQLDLLKKTLSYAWIALMRAMRRVQGQGKTAEGDPIRGMRGVFFDARKRGSVTSAVYSASAMLEHNCFQDRVATKVFERGFKTFPNDVDFALSYIKHLIEIQDTTNARAVFKTIASRLEKDPATVHRTKPLYAFWHDYEARYGELNLIKDVEKRMSELFPEDPKLAVFSSRYAEPGFDPCAIRPVVSPATQTKPKLPGATDVASITGFNNSPRPAMSVLNMGHSPKRSLEESDNESMPPRKMMRSDSPLKGAAGRRLDAKRAQTKDSNGVVGSPLNPHAVPPPTATTGHPLHPALYNFLKSLPPAHAARAQLPQVPPPAAVMELMRRADLSQFDHSRLMQALQQGYPPAPPTMQQAPTPTQGGWMPPGGGPPPPPYGYGQPQPPYGYR